MAPKKQNTRRNQKVQDVADDGDIVMEEMTAEDMQAAANFLNPSIMAADNDKDDEETPVASSGDQEKGKKDKENVKPKVST